MRIELTHPPGPRHTVARLDLNRLMEVTYG